MLEAETTLVAYVGVPNDHADAGVILNQMAEDLAYTYGGVFVSEGMGLWVDPRTGKMVEDTHVVRFEASCEARPIEAASGKFACALVTLKHLGALLMQDAVKVRMIEGLGGLVYTEEVN